MDFFSYLKKPDINESVEIYRKTSGAVLLDVRTDTEYKEGHIPDSINISVQKIKEAPNIIKDKNTPLFVYCCSGTRSKNACTFLQRMGYTNVKNIGGISFYSGEIVK